MIKNVQKFMTSLSSFELCDCSLSVHEFRKNERVKCDPKVSELFSNKTLNFTRFNIIKNLQKVVSSFSELIQNLNEKLFAGGDHLQFANGECVEDVGCLYSASHSILISLPTNEGSIL